MELKRTLVMRNIYPALISVVLLVAMASFALCDNYLKNADFKEGSQLWRGYGQATFLKPDGTEGSEDDPGAVAVIRLALSKNMVRTVFQEYNAQDAPGKVDIKVQVYASLDFKRSNRATDYDTDDNMPVTDFMFRYLPDGFQQASDLKPGAWVTVAGTLNSPAPSTDRALVFMVPPGDGVIYIKNPSVTP
jgi:hypothetical protein